MKLHRVQQRLTSRPLPDIEAAVWSQLAALEAPPKGPIAITGGSRGIANIATIIRAAGEWLREQGAEPFLAPCMGSHNGATAEGQQAMLEGLGMTEQAVGMPIRSCMDVVNIGSAKLISNSDDSRSETVWMDRYCHEAAGVLVINRVKLHTSFGGPPYGKHCESGLVKMMTVGMGKLPGAQSFHVVSTADKLEMLNAMGEAVIATGKVWGGLAILEDGYDQTAELHALPDNQIIEREPALLAHYIDTYYPRLPSEKLNVLLIQQMGKNFSGTGMDTNVIGRRGLNDAPDPKIPAIQKVGVLDLTDASHGNAVGVGLADVVTERLNGKVDHQKTLLNATTAGEPNKAQLPLVQPTDEALCDWLLAQQGETRWMLIPNTLHLGELYVSADMVEELQAVPNCEVDSMATELRFDDGELQLDW